MHTPCQNPASPDPSIAATIRTLDLFAVAGGIILLIALSVEILTGNHHTCSPAYFWIQFVVCVVFLLDLCLRMKNDPCSPSRFFWTRLPLFLLSVPYINIITWCNIPLRHDGAMLIGFLPMLRAFLALFIIVRWLTTTRVKALFWAYVITVIIFTYISSLIFYEYETGVNAKLDGFGNAFWWAWMNVTTVGAAIFPVTVIGKTVCVLLPIVGMAMFPIFTVYVVQEFSRKNDPAQNTSAQNGPAQNTPAPNGPDRRNEKEQHS